MSVRTGRRVFAGLLAAAAVPRSRAAGEETGFQGFKIAGRLSPKRSSAIPASMWGIQAGTLDDKLLERAADIGVKWTRLSASWPSIERRKGSYDWTQTDQAFRSVLRLGITPFVTLGGGNALYSPPHKYSQPELAEVYGSSIGPPTSSPEAMNAWLAFVKAAVERNRQLITHWEIWNEPNHAHYWGGQPNAAQYGRLVRETATVIRQANPKAVILAGSTAGLVVDYIDGFLGAGAAGLIDIVTFHNYGGVPEERIYRGLEVKKVLEKHNPRLQLWQGECGYPSHSSTRDYRGRGPWGPNVQAKWLLRQALTDTYFLGATMSNYFKLVDTGKRGEMPRRSFLSPIDRVLGFPERGGSRVKTVGVNEKCLLSNPDFQPKPGFFAYQNLCALIDSRYTPGKIEYKIEVEDAGPFYGIGAEDDAFPSVPVAACYNSTGGSLLAYWVPWYPSEHLPALARIRLRAGGVSFRNPVLVDLLNGNVYDIPRPAPGGQFTGLPLADYPLAIVERNQIELSTGQAAPGGRT